MRVIGRISTIETKPKYYWYHRKGYYVGERWVKPKKIRKCKYIPTEPYLFGTLMLLVDKGLDVGCSYVDDHDRKWLCTNKTITSEGCRSELKIMNPHLGKSFTPPSNLTIVYKPIGEK